MNTAKQRRITLITVENFSNKISLSRTTNSREKKLICKKKAPLPQAVQIVQDGDQRSNHNSVSLALRVTFCQVGQGFVNIYNSKGYFSPENFINSACE